MAHGNNSASQAYANAGVDITAGYESVELMKKHVAKTLPAHMKEAIGGFGGAFALQDFARMKEPVLVSGTDGVGTKIRLAQISDIHNTIGIDCVAMCANDIICAGAKPLFFLDYIACGKNVPTKIASIVEGVAEGCVQANCALIGGETAEHPGLMPPEEYDLAGFCVGIVDKDKMLDKKNVQVGDVLLALPSSGIHSNGFSLVRHVFDIEHADLNTPLPELDNETLREVLLTPTALYVRPIVALLEAGIPKSIAHITGGGFYENIPRALPKGVVARIDKHSLVIPPIFTYLQKCGDISEHDMFNTFNMGVGMVVVVAPQAQERALSILHKQGVAAYVMGSVEPATSDVQVELV